MEMIRRSGQQGVPVIASEDDVIVGFDQSRLARMAEKYAGPKRPPLGILGADTAQYLARHTEQREAIPAGTKGVYVGVIRPETVAERAGLQVGDVIVGFAGKKLRNMAQLDQLVATLKADETVTVSYLRDGETGSTKLQF